MRRIAVLLLVLASLACAGRSNEPPPEVKLSWDPVPEAQVVGYNVYRSGEPGRGFARVNPVPVKEPRYTDTAVERGKTYYYRVTAVNAGGAESGYSEESSKTVE